VTLIIGPNISLDQTVSVPRLTVGTIHRVPTVIKQAGGKGVNVARAMRTIVFGYPLLCGCLGGDIGVAVEGYLVRERIRYRPFHTQGETRVCFSIADEATGEQTEVYENGAPLTQDEVARFVALAEELMAQQANTTHSRWVGLTGSLPPGMPPDLYARLIASARTHGLHTLLDAKGEALRAGLAAGPTLLKVNAAELGDALGQSTLAQAEPAQVADVAAQAISHIPAGMAVITLGARGAVAVSSEGRWHVASPPVEAISPVGSGDSVAGAMLTLLENSPLDAIALRAAVRYGVAAGAANTRHLGAAQFAEAEVKELLDKTQVNPL